MKERIERTACRPPQQRPVHAGLLPTIRMAMPATTQHVWVAGTKRLMRFANA